MPAAAYIFSISSLLFIHPFDWVCLTSGCGSIFISFFGNVCELVTLLHPVTAKTSKTSLCPLEVPSLAVKTDLEANKHTQWMQHVQNARKEQGNVSPGGFGVGSTEEKI